MTRYDRNSQRGREFSIPMKLLSLDTGVDPKLDIRGVSGSLYCLARLGRFLTQLSALGPIFDWGGHCYPAPTRIHFCLDTIEIAISQGENGSKMYFCRTTTRTQDYFDQLLLIK